MAEKCPTSSKLTSNHCKTLIRFKCNSAMHTKSESNLKKKRDICSILFELFMLFSVCGCIKMKGSFVYATVHLFRINNIANCCCYFYSSFSIFRNGQWKWHGMTYLQIGSNRMSLTIMIFMSASFTLLCAMTTIL